MSAAGRRSKAGARSLIAPLRPTVLLTGLPDPAAGKERRIMVRGSLRHSRITAVILIGALVLAGCSATGGTGGAPLPADPVSAAGTATPSATPSPTPVPVEELFVDRLEELESASGSISGEMTVGEIEIPIDGEFAFDGEDSSTLVRFRVDDRDHVAQQVTIDTKTYERHGEGPWLLQRPGAGDDGLDDVLKDLREVEPAGGVMRDGRSLYRLRAPPSASSGFAGLIPDGAKDGQVVLEFLVDERGSLVVMSLDMSWTQAGGAGQTAADLHLDLEIEDVPSAMKIERPDDIWVARASTTHGYSYALPEDWEVTEDPDGLTLQGPGANWIYTFSDDVEPGMTLNAWTSGLIAYNQQESSAKPESNTAGTVAGQPARLLTYHVTIEGDPLYVVYGVFLRDGRAYEVAWFSTPGSEVTDRAMFERFLAQLSFPVATGASSDGTA